MSFDSRRRLEVLKKWCVSEPCCCLSFEPSKWAQFGRVEVRAGIDSLSEMHPPLI
jgi:hypothetical protein